MTRVICKVCNKIIEYPKRSEITTKKHESCMGSE